MNGEGKTVQFGAGFRLRKGHIKKIIWGFLDKKYLGNFEYVGGEEDFVMLSGEK
ncbi:MAG: hypothetical protein ACK56F_22050 [bacterium]